MRELTIMLDHVHTGALDAALRAALPGQVIGVSTYGPGRPISIWLQDSKTPLEEVAASTIAAAHDPVFLAADKLTIAADGTDTATLTISAPRSGAAPMSLLIAGAVVPVTLVNGTATLTITGADPASITIGVQNPSNRTTDQLTITAR